MNAPLDRLQWIRKQTGLNTKRFAMSVGMGAAGFHNMVARSSRVSRVLANSTELIHGYRAEWILTGEGLRREDESFCWQRVEDSRRWLGMDRKEFAQSIGLTLKEYWSLYTAVPRTLPFPTIALAIEAVHGIQFIDGTFVVKQETDVERFERRYGVKVIKTDEETE
jgi:hypothetical protein